MKNYIKRLLGTLALFGMSYLSFADVAYFNMERQQWFSQVGPNPMPYFYRFTTLATGVGFQENNLWVQGPAIANTLVGNSVQASYLTNVPALMISGTNIVSGFDYFNSLWPQGSYSLIERMWVINRYRTNIYPAILTNAFPQAPAITNISYPPLLQSNQTFRWPVFSANQSSYTVFYLFEGNLDTNILNDFKSGGMSSLTNLTLLARENRLSVNQNHITVTNVNPEADHLVLLEFHDIGPTNTSTLPVKEVGSVSANIILYLAPEIRIVAPPTSQSVPANSMTTFTVGAIGTPPISYQWRFNGVNIQDATNALLLLLNVQTNHAGIYDVYVSNPVTSVLSTGAVLTVTIPTNTPLTTNIVLIAPLITTDKRFHFKVEGDDDDVYEIEATSNLKTWSVIATVTNENNPLLYFDYGMPTNHIRFYRVKRIRNLTHPY